MRYITKFFSSVFCIVSILIFADIRADESDTEIFETKLSNGLTVVYCPAHSYGTLLFGILYDVGSGDDSLCKIGLSHFLEHMMFNGTHKLPGAKLKYLLSKYDANSNAFTGHDLTFYYHVVRSDFIDLDLQIEADRMKNLKFDKQILERERNVVLEERKLVFEGNPVVRYISDAVPKSLFLYSTYGYPVIGYPWQISNYSINSLQKHYRKYYNPNNATIVIVGSVFDDNSKTNAFLVDKIEKYFGKLKNNNVEKAIHNRVLDPIESGMTYYIDRAIDEIKTSELDIVYSFDAKLLYSFKRFITAKLLVSILSSYSTLKKNMIEETNTVYNINISFDYLKYSSNAFMIVSLSFNNGISRDRVEQELEKSITGFTISNDIVEKHKRKMLAQYDLQFDLLQDKFTSLAYLLSYGFSADNIRSFRHTLSTITYEDVIDMYRHILAEKNIVCRIFSHPKK